MSVVLQLINGLASDPLRLALLASLLVLLAVSIHNSWAFWRLRGQIQQEMEATRDQMEERLSQLEYAFQDLDPGSIERRDENLTAVLQTLLEYAESLRPATPSLNNQGAKEGTECLAD